MTCDELRPDYLHYVLGAIDEPERSEIGAHLARGCEKCAQGLREARALAYSLGAVVDGPQPSGELRRRVLEIASVAERELPERLLIQGRRTRFWFQAIPVWQASLLAAACLLFALVPAFLLDRQLSISNAKQTAAAAALTRAQRSSASLRRQIAELKRAALSPAEASPSALPVFSLELMRGGAGSEELAKQLTIPRAATTVVLALPIDLVREASTAELRNSSSQVIWAADLPRSADAEAAGLAIPSRLLTTGRYSVLLRAHARNVARFSLRVTVEPGR